VKIEFELNEKQESALKDVLAITKSSDGKPVDSNEFCRRAALDLIIKAKQQMVSSELQ